MILKFIKQKLKNLIGILLIPVVYFIVIEIAHSVNCLENKEDADT